MPALVDPFAAMDPSLGMDDLDVGASQAQDTQDTPAMSPQVTQAVLTPKLLDVKLQALLQQLTHNFAAEVGKLSQELRGKIAKIGDLVNYVKELEEETSSLKHSISQCNMRT